MAQDILLAWIAILGGTLASVILLTVGHLYRRIHEVRDRMRDLEAVLDALEPITHALRAASSRDLVALLKGGRRRA